jgi:hypothetical protein
MAKENLSIEARFRIRRYAYYSFSNTVVYFSVLPLIVRALMVHPVDPVLTPFRSTIDGDRITTLTHQQNVYTL